MEPITIKAGRERELYVCKSNAIYVSIAEINGDYAPAQLTPDECKAFENALAAARLDATPAPEQAEEEESGATVSRADLVIETCKGFTVSLTTGPALASLSLQGPCSERTQHLSKAQAAQLLAALAAFVKDEKPATPTAEVIAEHGGDALVRIRSSTFLIHQAEFAPACFRKTREEAQMKMLEWGCSSDDAYHATQAIDA